jgi:hypothetical protein
MILGNSFIQKVTLAQLWFLTEPSERLLFKSDFFINQTHIECTTY